jgi:hypothetical protein
MANKAISGATTVTASGLVTAGSISTTGMINAGSATIGGIVMTATGINATGKTITSGPITAETLIVGAMTSTGGITTNNGSIDAGTGIVTAGSATIGGTTMTNAAINATGKTITAGSFIGDGSLLNNYVSFLFSRTTQYKVSAEGPASFESARFKGGVGSWEGGTTYVVPVTGIYSVAWNLSGATTFAGRSTLYLNDADTQLQGQLASSGPFAGTSMGSAQVMAFAGDRLRIQIINVSEGGMSCPRATARPVFNFSGFLMG